MLEDQSCTFPLLHNNGIVQDSTLETHLAILEKQAKKIRIYAVFTQKTVKWTNPIRKHDETVKNSEGKNEMLSTEIRHESELPGSAVKRAKKNLVIFTLECLKGCLEQCSEYCSTQKNIFVLFFSRVFFFFFHT